MADVRAALQAGGFAILREVAAPNRPQFGGPSFVVPYRRDVNGTVVVDIVDRPWPDTMGHPKMDPDLFAAWSLGYFGPFAFPDGLKRASEHCWNWPAGREMSATHKGVIRLRLTYAGNARDEDPAMPKDCDPVSELEFLTRLAIAVGVAPGVICYYNSNGEVLRDVGSLKFIFEDATLQKKLPVLLWANARFFRLSPEFFFMDTVGNAQLNVPDIEVVSPVGGSRPGDLDYYMRNVTHYLLGVGRELKSGEAIDGPGEHELSWVIDVPKRPLMTPPRRVLRLFPKAHAKAIRKALSRIA